MDSSGIKPTSRSLLVKGEGVVFFDRFYERGWDWYQKYFSKCSQKHKVVGEISHDYLFSTLACERIACDLPSVKLMVCLREPVERAFSAYLYMKKQGRVAGDFGTALKELDELIDHGRYATHLRRYSETFGRERLHVAVFDDLVACPQEFYDDICDFLEVGRRALPRESEGKVNPATRPRWRYIGGFARMIGWQIRRWGMPGLVGAVKESALVKRLLYEEYSSESKPEIRDDARLYMRDKLTAEVQDLDALIGTDLCSRWGYPRRAESPSWQP